MAQVAAILQLTSRPGSLIFSIVLAILFPKKLRPSMLAWGIVLALLAVILCLTPLFNVLGFEFCFAIGLLTSFAGAQLGAISAHDDRFGSQSAPRENEAPTFRRTVAIACLRTSSLLILPLGLISLNAFRVKNCSFSSGIAFFVLLPVLSALIATSVGIVLGYLVKKRWQGILFSLFAVICSLLWSIYRFYTQPPIFAYDPFGGYFPGSLYDEALSIPKALLWARAYHLCWVASALLLLRMSLAPRSKGPRLESLLRCLRPRRNHAAQSIRPTVWRILCFVLALLSAIVMSRYDSQLGFRIDREFIQQQLGGHLTTSHFDIYYSQRLPAIDRARLAEDHEFRYEQLKKAFGHAPEHLSSYIFESADEKHKLMGASRTLITKPWLGEMFLQAQSFPHASLKHEMAHLFAAEYGDSLLKLSLAWRRSRFFIPVPHLNIGLLEGVAVAVDWPAYGEMDAHQLAATLFRLKLAPPLSALFGLGFFTHANTRTYILAGSFCRFLLVRYGIDPLMHAYRQAGSFKSVYSQTLKNLLDQWKEYLMTIKIRPYDLELARQRFARPSIFQRVCAHRIANLVKKARSSAGIGDLHAAERFYMHVCQLDGNDPSQWLEWLRYRALTRGPRTVIERIGKLLEHPALSATQQREVLEFYGDQLWLLGQTGAATTAYRKAANFPANAASRRRLYLKRLKWPKNKRMILMSYLVPPHDLPNDGAKLIQLAHGIIDYDATLELNDEETSIVAIGNYLLARQLAARHHCTLAIKPLKKALSLSLPNEDFTMQATYDLGVCLYQTAALDDSQVQFNDMIKQLGYNRGRRVNARDWLARIDWASAR